MDSSTDQQIAAEIASLESRVRLINEEMLDNGGIYGSPGAPLIEQIDELRQEQKRRQRGFV